LIGDVSTWLEQNKNISSAAPDDLSNEEVQELMDMLADEA